MKDGIHPEYKTVKVHCACGKTFATRSTQDDIHVDDNFLVDPRRVEQTSGESPAAGTGR